MNQYFTLGSTDSQTWQSFSLFNGQLKWNDIFMSSTEIQQYRNDPTTLEQFRRFSIDKVRNLIQGLINKPSDYGIPDTYHGDVQSWLKRFFNLDGTCRCYFLLNKWGIVEAYLPLPTLLGPHETVGVQIYDHAALLGYIFSILPTPNLPRDSIMHVYCVPALLMYGQILSLIKPEEDHGNSFETSWQTSPQDATPTMVCVMLRTAESVDKAERSNNPVSAFFGATIPKARTAAQPSAQLKPVVTGLRAELLKTRLGASSGFNLPPITPVLEEDLVNFMINRFFTRASHDTATFLGELDVYNQYFNDLYSQNPQDRPTLDELQSLSDIPIRKRDWHLKMSQIRREPDRAKIVYLIRLYVASLTQYSGPKFVPDQNKPRYGTVQRAHFWRELEQDHVHGNPWSPSSTVIPQFNEAAKNSEIGPTTIPTQNYKFDTVCNHFWWTLGKSDVYLADKENPESRTGQVFGHCAETYPLLYHSQFTPVNHAGGADTTLQGVALDLQKLKTGKYSFDLRSTAGSRGKYLWNAELGKYILPTHQGIFADPCNNCKALIRLFKYDFENYGKWMYDLRGRQMMNYSKWQRAQDAHWPPPGRDGTEPRISGYPEDDWAPVDKLDYMLDINTRRRVR